MEFLLEKIADARHLRQQSVIKVNRFATVMGSMTACTTAEGICLLEFSDSTRLAQRVDRLKRRFRCPIVSGRHVLLSQLKQELKLYLSGDSRKFSVPVILDGTDFQVTVWRELQRIAYGETLTYSQLAVRAGNSAAVRATAAANGANPLSILVPCHRVMGANGSLTGYSGGIRRKAWLLELENS